jgi:hypothetical protein
MNRAFGLVLAVVLFSGLNTTTRAQTDDPPFGGFGYDYAQVPPSNSIVLDRFWMPVQTPAVGTAPAPAIRTSPTATVVTTQPRAAAAMTRPRVDPAAKRTARAHRRYGMVPMQGSYQLPTGSLYWPAAAGVSLYSPAQRYQSYDFGYDKSPYGSIEYGSMYKGFLMGY